MSAYLVSESRVIAASPQALFDIVADPAMHPVMDGSGSVQAVRSGGPDRLSMGAKFGMDMKLGASYKILNTVVEFDEPTVLAWRHFNGHIWRYQFKPVNAGTEVTEQWDATVLPIWKRLGVVAAGFGRRNRAGIKATLKKLDELATQPTT